MKSLIILMLAQAQGGNPLMSFLPLVLIIVVFYFFMIRPQMKKQKEMQKFRDALKKGDKIVTTGGIYGKIVDIDGNIITIEVDDNVKLKVDKVAVLADPRDLNSK